MSRAYLPDKDKGKLNAKAGVASFQGNFGAPAEMSAGQRNYSKKSRDVTASLKLALPAI